MEEENIKDIITAYLVANHKSLRGVMPYTRYFVLYDRLIDRQSYANTKEGETIVMGTAIDVLADALENERFFEGYLGKIVENAISPSAENTRIRPLTVSDEINGSFKVNIYNGNISLDVRVVSQKVYLNILRTPEGFIQTARKITSGLNLPVEGDLEQIAREIYS